MTRVQIFDQLFVTIDKPVIFGNTSRPMKVPAEILKYNKQYHLHNEITAKNKPKH